MEAHPEPLEIGKARQIETGDELAIICLGTMLDKCRQVAQKLQAEGVSVSLVDARFAKPFDKELLAQMGRTHKGMVIVEESSPGGFSAHLLQYLSNEGVLDNGLKIRVASLPDQYFDHADREEQLRQAGLDSDSLYQLCKTVTKTFQHEDGKAKKSGSAAR